MSNNTLPSIEILPVELFHQIFDNLDAQTILYCIRPVSRLFLSIVNTYNRYILNLNFISKLNFYLFCGLIHPQNILSLTLSNDELTFGPIHLFVSLVRLRQFTRLRSLTLININKSQLNFILTRINFPSLTSFSLNIKEYDDEITALLSSTLTRTNLFKLELNTSTKTSMNSLAEYFIETNRINIVDLCKILQYSSHLHTLIIPEIPQGTIDNLTSRCFSQLTSLTIKNLSVTIDELEVFLLMTPSLVDLKLIGGRKMFNGKRWEQFIQVNLPQLDKFEFYITELRSKKQTLIDLKLTIASFQTPFWTEHKKWFFICEYQYTMLLHTISLYSIPICTSHMYYTSKSDKISLSTDPIMNRQTTMDNIKSLSLTLNNSTAEAIQEKCAMVHQPLFHKVTEIDLEFCDDWPRISLRSLLIFIDISRIVHIKISSNYLNEYNQILLKDMRIFFEQAHNLISLFLHSSFYRHKVELTVEDIHSILPYHVKHLQIPIDHLDQINLILERCPVLSIIEFDIEGVEFGEQVINWFWDHTIDSTCREGNQMVTVWLGKKRIQSTEISDHHKRIKFQ